MDLGMQQLREEGCDSWGDLCWEQRRVATAGLTGSGAEAGPLKFMAGWFTLERR